MGELIEGAVQQAPQPLRQEGGASGCGMRGIVGHGRRSSGSPHKMYRFLRVVQMQMLPLSEFRANASAMLDLVEQGETVRILRHGKPVADLVPVRESAAERVPSWKRKIEPLQIARPDGKTGAQLIIEEREQARY
jgi:prevent-host-death family protein